MIAAVTITYNRLDLTERTVESFYSKTKVDYHVFVDNGSTDGTQDYIRQFPHILLEKNYGITEAFFAAASQLDYDYILKLDNDIEVVSENIVERILEFYQINGDKFIVSPVDLNLDPKFAPKVLKRLVVNNSHGVSLATAVTHTGGAFQVIPKNLCRMLIDDYYHFKQGDMAIGEFARKNGYQPVYLTDLQIRHIGLNRTSENYVL